MLSGVTIYAVFIAGDVKLIQLATFFAEIDKVLDKYREKTGFQLPLVVCGDFNSTPFSPVFNLITSGVLNYNGNGVNNYLVFKVFVY